MSKSIINYIWIAKKYSFGYRKRVRNSHFSAIFSLVWWLKD